MIWPAGKKLHQGKYIILGEPLGQGGFGITYKAKHVHLQEAVVIKTPIDYRQIDLQDPVQYREYVKDFLKEGQKLAKLSPKDHPNIVRVRDVFQESTIPCLVMDFVPGKNLFKLVKERGRLPEAKAVDCIRQICDALATMHKMGLVHRDAHPGNIILRDDGRAVLIDFGIAKELITTQTITGKAGNIRFAPYEQLSSKGSRKPNVDVYCLAATLYYTITGQYPMTSLDRKLHNIRLIPPQQIVPSISQHLNQAILKGMELEAKDRPQLMQEWLHEIDMIANTPKQVSRRTQTNSSVLKNVKTTLIILPQAFLLCVQQLIQILKLLFDYLHKINYPKVSWGKSVNNFLSLLVKWLFWLENAFINPHQLYLYLRNRGYIGSFLLVRLLTLTILFIQIMVLSYFFLPFTVSVLSQKDPRPLTLTEQLLPSLSIETSLVEQYYHQGIVWCLSFSPDGQQIGTGGANDKIKFWDLSGAKKAEFKKKDLNCVSFSPDGQQFAMTGADGTIRILSRSGQEQLQLPGHQKPVHSVTFSSDGEHIATAGEEGIVRLWNISGQLLETWEADPSGIWSMGFSPDGKQLVTSSRGGRVRRWNLSGELLRAWIASEQAIWGMSFSPDGEQIATGGTDGKVRLWSLSGEKLTEWRAHNGEVRSVIFSPNGQQIATAGDDSTVKLWRKNPRGKLAEFGGYSGRVISVNFSPDGQQIVAAGDDGIVQLWHWRKKD